MQVTAIIVNARLAKLQARIRFYEETGQYFLQDLHSADGTWLQSPLNQFTTTALAPNMSVAIGPYIFRIELGSPVDVMEELVAKYNLLPWLTSLNLRPTLEEFATFNYEELQQSADTKERFKQAVEDARKHQAGFVGLRFTDGLRRFQAGIRDVLIGSGPGCDVVISGLKEKHAIVSYREDAHLMARLVEDAQVFLRLLPEEEVYLVPGSLVKMGNLDFEVCRFNIGRCAETGVRTSMEDCDIVVQDLGLYEGLPMSFFAVYDGHGGSQCSQYLQEHFHLLIRNNLLQSTGLHFDVNKTLSAAIQKACLECDQGFYQQDPVIARTIGSTAVICFILGDKIVTANVGDSRAILCRKGQAIDLTVDHKAVTATQDRLEERKRIEEKGGVIAFKRLLGRLAVSRAFGDFEFKNVGEGEMNGKVTGPLLSSEPEIREEYLHPLDDEFLLLASDGLFDVFSSQEVTDLIRRKLLQMPLFEQDPQRVVREVVNEAIYTRQSKDNVTAILVNLTCGLK